jgi:Tol biopolymer transport system component
VSVSSSGDAGNGGSFQPKISANGRYVTFVSEAPNLVPGDANGLQDVFVHDLKKGTTELISIAREGDGANGVSSLPSISGDGRFVTYASDASNLVPDDTNGLQDVFVFDRRTDTTRRLSVAYDGEEANGFSSEPTISDNGRHVTFVSDASNLVPGDANGAQDVFVARTHDWFV